MSDQPINLVLEHLRAMHADLVTLRDDVRDLKFQMTDLRIWIASLRRDQANDAEASAHIHVRLDS
jgi:hypothetical protein